MYERLLLARPFDLRISFSTLRDVFDGFLFAPIPDVRSGMRVQIGRVINAKGSTGIHSGVAIDKNISISDATFRTTERYGVLSTRLDIAEGKIHYVYLKKLLHHCACGIGTEGYISIVCPGRTVSPCGVSEF